jgi:hypothetical protein
VDDENNKEARSDIRIDGEEEMGSVRVSVAYGEKGASGLIDDDKAGQSPSSRASLNTTNSLFRAGEYLYDPEIMIDDEGFDAWVQSLGRWPLVPDPPPLPSTTTRRRAMMSSTASLLDGNGTTIATTSAASGSFLTASPSTPLSRLLDLEALWVTLQKLTSDSESDDNDALLATGEEAEPSSKALTATNEGDNGPNATTPSSTTASTPPAQYDDGIIVPTDSSSSLLDGLNRILSVERILQAGNLFRVFERDRQQASFAALSNRTVAAVSSSAATTGDKISPSPPNTSSTQQLASSPSSPLSSTLIPSISDPTPFRYALSQLEGFVNDASSLLRSQSVIIDLVLQASQVLQEVTTAQNATQVLKAATRVLQSEQEQQDVDEGTAAVVGDSADAGDVAVKRKEDAERRIQDALAFSAKLVSVADAVLRQGYVGTTKVLATVTSATTNRTKAAASPATAAAAAPSSSSRALFADFATAQEIVGSGSDEARASPLTPLVKAAAEMGTMAGAIYEQTVHRVHALRQAIVARGVTADVAWMVTDALATNETFASTRDGSRDDDDDAIPQRDVKGSANATGPDRQDPFLVRTITIRGFDASDESVDREGLLVRVCTASPTAIKVKRGTVVEFHGGMWAMARKVYNDIKAYVSWTAPEHKIVLTGHSIGGSIANLVLLLMTMDLGPEYVKSKILRVYTYGSPPVARLQLLPEEELHRQVRDRRFRASYRCDVLEAFDLPGSLVEGYVQPWDPIVRLFSEIDPLYPLLSDVGADGVTPWASGPPRTLRPITKAIMEAWEGWPRFRDALGTTGNQTYRSIGVQNILVPEPTRYLADRFVGVNVQVPPVSSLVRISSRELLPALKLVFPLDVFEISFVPQAIRSFVHHFYPAYGFPLVDYVKRFDSPPVATKRTDSSGNQPPPSSKDSPVDLPVNGEGPALVDYALESAPEGRSDIMAELARAAQWLQGKEADQ